MARENQKKAALKSLVKSQAKRKKYKSLINLNFNGLMTKFNRIITCFPDKRRGKNISKSLRDAALCGFSLFFTQSPSFLAYQTLMREAEGMDNAQSLFGITEILSDNHIRDLLDGVPPSLVSPLYFEIVEGLFQAGYLKEFSSYKDNILLGLDGVQYYGSEKISCSSCSCRKDSKGKKRYYHSAVLAALVNPDQNHVISLPPEFIVPQDGSDKQDCELNASQRWLEKYSDPLVSIVKSKKKSKKKGITLLGDDLYCHQPFCQELLDRKWDFILTCKPKSHKTLYEYIQLQHEDIRTLQIERWTGRRYELDTYRFLNTLPLRDGDDALEVNWCEVVTTVKKSGKVIYKNSFATNFRVTEENVQAIVRDGRARWKIENENNNVLKTKGYHLEHNFGHGDNHLSALFVTFNILAFLFHTILYFSDQRYRLLRQTIANRTIFYNDLRALTRYLYFSSWDGLMIFMMQGLKIKPRNTPP